MVVLVSLLLTLRSSPIVSTSAAAFRRFQLSSIIRSREPISVSALSLGRFRLIETGAIRAFGPTRARLGTWGEKKAVACGFDMDEYISHPTNVCSHPAPHLARDYVRRGDRQVRIHLDVKIDVVLNPVFRA